VPIDRLLIETDCPYLAPHPHRGKRNETGYVRLVAQTIAELRGMTLEALAEQTTANACRLFGIEA
jgi:TatD DNase family protein